MYYSKRPLYALGDPLGESVTQRKAGGGMIYGGGGGGGSAPSGPTNTTVTNTNIPDYAQPYVSNMLNAAQAQIYTPDMTGFNPYTPYSTNPQDYVAGFSPMQQQAQSTVANMQTPQTFNSAIGQTQNTMNQFGRLGNQMGNAGNQYAQTATNPYATAAYMNPYIQNSLAPQLQLAQQQYGMQGAQEQANATQQGAFGGSREALMNGLNQQNSMLAQNQIIGNGYNNAFNQAQQAQQFGANLGLQGQQAQAGALASQMSGANQLAGLGGQQLAAQQGIANMQNQFGGQQQANQQNIINQAVQNYATAQQYPYMQLGQLNAMLRGLPMQQSSTSMYQAAPSTVSQLGGLGIAGLGAAGMYKAATGASGGQVKTKKMAVGGAIPMNMMSPQQLTQVQQSPMSSPMAKISADGLDQLHNYINSNPESAKIMAQPLASNIAQGSGVPAPMVLGIAPENNRVGVGSIGTGDMTQMAGGGIIAFADEGQVKDPSIPRGKKGELDLASILADRLSDEQSGKGTVSEAYKPLAATQQEDIKQQRAMLLPEMATRFGLGLMNSQGGRGGSLLTKTLQDVGTSGLGAVQGMTSNLRDLQAAKKQLGAGTIEAAKADQARRDALTGNLVSIYGTQEAKKIGMAQAAATRQAGIDAKTAALMASAREKYTTNVNNAFRNLSSDDKAKLIFGDNKKAMWEAARDEVYNSMPPAERALVGLDAPQVSANPAPAAAPAAATATPVQVTIPAANGRGAQVVSFPSQAAADQFTNSPQYKAYIGAPAGQKTD